MLAKYLFSWLLIYLPFIVSGAIILVLIINSLYPDRKYLLFLNKLNAKKLTYIFISFLVFFAFLLSFFQYSTWYNEPFSRFFLPPHTSINYFLRYSFFHFWLASLISFVCSFGFYFIFKIIKKYRDEIISQKEISLILLASLLVSWPKFIIFVPLFLLLTLVFALVNLLIFKSNKNTLIVPIIISLIVTFLTGNYLINLLSLSSLII